MAERLAPRATGEAGFSLTVPDTQAPGDVAGGARMRYVFDGAEVVTDTPLTVKIVSPLSADPLRATPSPARPGATVQVTTTLRNAGRTPVTGAVQVKVPAGWATPSAVPATVPAGGSVDVTTAVTVPRDAQQTVNDVTLTAAFTRDGAELATASGTLRVEIAPVANAFDRVDLGNAASEQAHALTASPPRARAARPGSRAATPVT